MREEIKYLGSLSRLDVRPGDKFVLVLDHAISSDAGARLQAIWRDFVGQDQADETKLLILDGGCKIGVIGKEAE